MLANEAQVELKDAIELLAAAAEDGDFVSIHDYATFGMDFLSIKLTHRRRTRYIDD
ncbi:MAG: hypothetical protein ACI9J2_001024 [Saprospiraceae bacterium]|jgi:hypothetical protein